MELLNILDHQQQQLVQVAINPTASGWSGTYNLSDEESDDGSASIIGNYTLKKSGKYNNSASCKAKCSKSGKISFSGDYDESTII